jgi:sulfite reductase (NADPH) flavoprotein alpha-component
MPLSPIPKTAPFAEEEIELLNRVVGTATATQRVWLAGFLAGLEASTASSQPIAPPVAAEPLTIIYATESGNSEKLAADLAKATRKTGLRPSLIDMADLDVATLASARRLVVIAATWGEGEPPARATRAYNELMSEGAPRLDGIEFGVLALGDSAYAEFCATGQRIDQRLAALGGKRVIERVDCDIDFATPAARWIEQAVQTLAPADATFPALIMWPGRPNTCIGVLRCFESCNPSLGEPHLYFNRSHMCPNPHNSEASAGLLTLNSAPNFYEFPVGPDRSGR